MRHLSVVVSPCVSELARELEFNEDEIQEVRTENPNSLQEQSHALLQRWAEREGKHATGMSVLTPSVLLGLTWVCPKWHPIPYTV